MTRVKDDYKRTTISLRTDEYEALRFMTFKRKTSVARVVRELIPEHLEEAEDIYDCLKTLEEKGEAMEWETFKKHLRAG